MADEPSVCLLASASIWWNWCRKAEDVPYDIISCRHVKTSARLQPANTPAVNCQFLNEVCHDILEAMVCMPWHHCTGFPSANGRLYPVLCVPHIRIRDGRCDTNIVTSLLCYLHADAFRFSCGEAVTWAALGVIREKAGIAAVVSAEQAQLMHYLWSFCILEHLHWWVLPLWHKTDSFICFSDTTAVLLPLMFALMTLHYNYSHLKRQVTVNRFHLRWIKTDLWSGPCLRATWLCVSGVIIYCADIRGRWLRLDYLACVLRLLSGHTVIGLCRHIFSYPVPSVCPSFLFSPHH